MENNDAFLNLLKPENLKKIKIDDRLIPIFKIVINKINNFFIKGGYIKAKEWNSFFDKFLLTENDNQYSIILDEMPEDYFYASGLFSKTEKKIRVDIRDYNENNFKFLCHELCHEFIHFLVMTESNNFGWKISESILLNEGLTELLTSLILGDDTSAIYYKHVTMAKFYCELSTYNDVFINFLNDQFAIKNTYKQANIIRNTSRIDNCLKKDILVFIQRQLIESFINNYQVDTFEQFVNVIGKLNKRLCFDFEYVKNIYEKLTSNFIDKYDIEEGLKEDLKRKLINFCLVSDKAFIYKNNEVAEYRIDDIYIGFDKNGKIYNEFPISGEKKKGSIEVNIENYIINHKDKTYIIDKQKMKYINWNDVYNSCLMYFSEYDFDKFSLGPKKS